MFYLRTEAAIFSVHIQMKNSKYLKPNTTASGKMGTSGHPLTLQSSFDRRKLRHSQ